MSGKVIQIINRDTGELLSSRVVEEKPFGFIKDINYVRVGTVYNFSPIIIKAGICITFIVDSNTNKFKADGLFKDYLLKKLEIGEPRYYQLMKELRDGNIIYALENKNYMLNPKYFCRCRTLVRMKLIKLYDKMVYNVQDVVRSEEEVSGTEYAISP